ncbi:MAG: hypothetical protein V7K26_01355 [Nostoc sp.]|uniref:hypothetical protein n=1 Tax=Nostoc sp. TaxID=1180 RepID=UPI002FEFA9D7
MTNTTLGEAAPTTTLSTSDQYNSWRGSANDYALLYERLRQRLRSGQAQEKLSTSDK